MNNNTEVTETAQQTPDISNPDLSFTDYQAIRRGEFVTDGKSAPDSKDSEQKAQPKSDIGKTDESKEEDESDDDLELSSESNESEKDQPKKKGGFQRRIDKLNSRYSEEKGKREALETRLAQLEAGKTEAKQVEASQQLTNDGKPDPETFETHSEYVEALTEWKIDQRESKAKESAKQEQLKADYEKVRQSHFDREAAFSDKTEDYKDVVSEFLETNPKTSSMFEQLLVASDVGPQILYALAKDSKEFERINSLNPIAIAKEFGKLEAKYSNLPSEETKQEIKKITKAPNPIEPVGKGSSGAIRKSITDPDLPFSEYERMRREQIKRKNR